MNEPRIILVRYDEIGLKGKNRGFFENCLFENIQYRLREVKGAEYRMPRGRILIYVEPGQVDDCVRDLGWVPGIASYSVGIPVPPDPGEISRLGASWIRPLLEPGRELKFCVKTQRTDKSFPMSSPEFNHEVGRRIIRLIGDPRLTVNIKYPDFMLEVEIGMKETVVFHQRHPGLRGLPVGSAGPVLTLISGGIDSPVAAQGMIRRGCRSHFVFFDNRPFLGRGAYDKVVRLARHLNRYQNRGRLFVVPFDDIQVNIRDRCRPPHRVVLYRRLMYRIAHAIAEEHSYKALVTGESLGQVASQTLENLAAVSCVVPLSVFRPLIGMDKQDIIHKAKQIGTYEISIEPHPDCCSVFMPDKPVTRSKIPRLEADEKQFPWRDLMREALEKTETVDLD